MKALLAKYKFYLLAAVFIASGGIYYFFIYKEVPTTSQQVNKLDNSATVAKEAAPSNEQQPKPAKAETVMVDVKGEIKHPGVYTSNATERVNDIIERAGGLTDKADENQVNFAAHVKDEMVIYIPAKGTAGTTGSTPVLSNTAPAITGGANGTTQDGKININEADVNDLQNLPGIGPAKAAAIIQYREENGPFQAIEDLKNISGIGDKTFEKLKDSISL